MKKIFLLILVVITVIFTLYKKINNFQENFTNICWSLQYNHIKDIINQYKKLITSYGLDNYINKIIEPLVKPNYIDKKLTLEKYFNNIKIPFNKIDQATILVKNIVNNNNLISPLVELDIKKNNLLLDIVSTFNINNLINSMLCVINDSKVIMNLFQQLLLVIISPKIEFCSKNYFNKYCESSYNNYLDKIKPKLKVKVVKTAKSVSPRLRIRKVKVINKNEIVNYTQKIGNTMRKIKTGSVKLFKHGAKVSSLLKKPMNYLNIYSLSEHLKNFNVKSFGSVLEKNMMVLLTKFKNNTNKDFNIFIKKDFGKLIGILVSDIKMVIKNIVDEDDFSKLKPYVNEFNNLQKIFYLLKHNYRLLLTYELINKKIINNDEKLQAQLCCSKTSEKSCFNFSSNPKKSLALFYGFDELGYVKNVKCIKKNKFSKILDREQNMTINQLFNKKYAAWRNISKENKSIIFANLINLFKIFGIELNNINDKIINIRLKLEKQKYKLNMSDFKLNKIPYKFSNINSKFKVNNDNYKNLVNRIKISDNLVKLNEILKLLGYSKDDIIFNNNVELIYAKNITETLLLINEIFKNFESNNPIVVGKLLGIIKTQESFSKIMRTTAILNRYHQTIVDFVIKNITDKKFATVRSYTMNSLPETTIKYHQSKPSSSKLNFCNVYEEYLMQFRKDRSITNDEFNKLLQKSISYCRNKQNL